MHERKSAAGRGFFPTEIIFAPTNSCNLRCAHCTVPKDAGRLDIGEAERFLRACASGAEPESGGTAPKRLHIERVGFSGGEPFLYQEFIERISAAAVEEGLLFGRIMTNGLWWQSKAELAARLEAVRDAGFDGRLGVSFDAFHGQNAGRTAAFCRTAIEVWNDAAAVEIQTAVPPGGRECALALLDGFAAELGCTVRGTLKRTQRRGALILEGGGAFLTAFLFPQSFRAQDREAWRARKWFSEDFCEGPGQLLYVHPDGSVAPCCGFANGNAALKIGTIRQTPQELLRAAAENPMVRRCYTDGLSALRRKMKKGGVRFPGRTDDNCTFCDFACACTEQADAF
ncbi:MAG: radical SAM protein [Treponemataceae bacterium]|nr:radical SAM protein [Treponemataceae bacterium]